MSAVTTALALRRLRQDSPVLGLMRQDLMPVIAAELAEHLGGDERQVSAAQLYELIDDDLDQLRRQGVDVPRTAQSYCSDWVHQGFLIRHPVPKGRGELFEMSPAGHEAVRFLERLAEPPPSATESKLTIVGSELRRLAADTDPAAASRLAALERERERLDRRIEATRRGDFEPVDDLAARERLATVVAEARDIPADFARVRDSMDTLSRELRRELIEDDSSQGSVLDDIFVGVDRIHGSPEGRSFDAFHALVMDPEAEALFAEAVDQIAGRRFAAGDEAGALTYLAGFMGRLQRESLDVNRSMGLLSRSLRQFVQSRQFEMFREMADRLRSAERAAADAVAQGALAPTTHMGFELELTSGDLGSVGRLALHVPSQVQAPADVDTHDAGQVSWEDLRDQVRESQIDFAELRDDIIDTVGAIGPATIGQVLGRHPATQGLASVVGLFVLGTRAGRAADRAESVRWTQADGQDVRALMSQTYTFQEVPRDWI